MLKNFLLSVWARADVSWLTCTQINEHPPAKFNILKESFDFELSLCFVSYSFDHQPRTIKLSKGKLNNRGIECIGIIILFTFMVSVFWCNLQPMIYWYWSTPWVNYMALCKIDFGINGWSKVQIQGGK
jgi:hypothetical protein